MGVYIKGMEMPKRCEDCFCYRHNAEYDYAYCNISSVKVLGNANARLNNCPLVPAQEHGRLIDADALIAKLNMMIAMAFGEGNTAFHFAYRSLGKVVENAPTVIEAEEGE